MYHEQGWDVCNKAEDLLQSIARGTEVDEENMRHIVVVKVPLFRNVLAVSVSDGIISALVRNSVTGWPGF